MYLDVLSEKQKKLLPFISQFRKEYYLVGGTAIALQIGHRRSIDFDLLKKNALNKSKIKKKIIDAGLKIERTLYEDTDQLHFLIEGVKVTFFQYPYDVPRSVKWEKTIMMPNLLDLSAMKAFAMGKRAKWKDYVDMFFILKEYHTLQEIVKRAYEIFGEEFNDKLFREQLAYFKDLNYEEEVEFCRNETPKEIIEAYLTNIATDTF